MGMLAHSQVWPPPEEYEVERVTRLENVLKVSCEVSGTTSSFTIKLDGSEVVHVDGELGVKTTTRSRVESGKIITDWKLERDSKVIIEGHEVRSLSEDGNRQI